MTDEDIRRFRELVVNGEATEEDVMAVWAKPRTKEQDEEIQDILAGRG